jgi:hypothetical protein
MIRGQIHGLVAVLGAVAACLPDSAQFERELADAAEMSRAHALAETGISSELLLKGLEQVLETFEETAAHFRNAQTGAS